MPKGKKGKKKGKGPPPVVTEWDDPTEFTEEKMLQIVPAKQKELNQVSQTRNHEQLERDTLQKASAALAPPRY